MSCIKSPCFIANSSSWPTIILGEKEKVLAWSAQRVIEDWQSDQGGINPSSSQLQWGAILGWRGRSLFRKLGDRNVPLIQIASCQKARFVTVLSGSEVSWVRFSQPPLCLSNIPKARPVSLMHSPTPSNSKQREPRSSRERLSPKGAQVGSYGKYGNSKVLLVVKNFGKTTASWRTGIGFGKADKIAHLYSPNILGTQIQRGSTRARSSFCGIRPGVIFRCQNSPCQSLRQPEWVIFPLWENTNSSPGSY